jgi:hypothetical protein
MKITEDTNKHLSQHELDMVVGRTPPQPIHTRVGVMSMPNLIPNGPMAVVPPGGFKLKEQDPNGLSANAPGAKLDAGKVRPALVLGGFARALLAVSRIGTFGAVKYTENGWMVVPNGEARYDDAKLRHWLTEKTGVEFDPDSEEEHAAHEAWNALARLDLILRRKEKQL